MQQLSPTLTDNPSILSTLQEMQDVWKITGLVPADLCPQVIANQLQAKSLGQHIPWQDKARLRATSYWLKLKPHDATLTELVEGYLDAHDHLVQLQLWPLCLQLLWLQAGANPLYHQLQVLGWYARALELFTPLLPKINDRSWQCFIYYELGHIHALLGNLDQAIEMLTTQIALAEALDLPRALMRGLGELGWVYGYCQSNAEAALECYQRQLQLARHLKFPVEEAKALDGLARVNCIRGHWRRCSQYYQHAWKLIQTTDASAEDQLLILLRLEGSYLDWAKLDQNLALPQERLKLAQEIGNKYYIWHATHDIGGIYIRTRQWEKAEATMQQAISLAREMQAPHRISLSVVTLGACYIRRRDGLRGIAYTQEALHGFQQAGNQIAEAQTWFNLSYCYSDMGQPMQALRCAVHLRRLVQRNSSLSYMQGMLLLVVAYAHWRRRRHIKALWLCLLGLFYLGGWRSAEGRTAISKLLSVLRIRKSQELY
jgi:tetratricopeptide (TPR) repeat protein